jgi:N-methylhydantoinase B/oxoprolinase/acetone carboxylase alpha subunit
MIAQKPTHDGDPLDHLADWVAEDLREGYGSADHAREAYGVMLRRDRRGSKARPRRRGSGRTCACLP